jgi:hypothetical protein
MYWNHTLSKTTSPRNGLGTTAFFGLSIKSGVSRSWKILSAEDIADCITAYFWLKSRSGTKKRWRYSLNATRVPMPMAPCSASPPPYHNSSATLTEPAASTIE